jgi:hypothetical protein
VRPSSGRPGAPSGGSVLEQVACLASVSGRSVAATYYASQKPPRETLVLTLDGALTDGLPDVLRQARRATEPGLRERPALAPTPLLPVAQLVAGGPFPHRGHGPAPAGTHHAWRPGPPGGARGQPAAEPQHHIVQQRPTVRAHHAAARRLAVRLLCGPWSWPTRPQRTCRRPPRQADGKAVLDPAGTVF